MQKSPFWIIAAVGALYAHQAQAQSFAGITHEGSTFTLGGNYHNDANDAPFGENYTTQLSAQSSYSLGNNFGATVTLGYNSEQYDEEFFSERLVLELNPTYAFGDGTIGLFYALAKYNDGSFQGDDISYGVTASFNVGAVGFEGYAGTYEPDGADTFSTLGIAASYAVSSDIDVYVVHRRDGYEGSDFAALSGIGGSYDLAGTAGIPIRLGVEASRFHGDLLSLSESEWNQVSFFVSYDIGNGARSVFRGFRAQDYYYD